MERPLIQVMLAFDEPATLTAPGMLGEQFGPLSVVPGTERVQGGPDRRLSGWFRVVHVATGRRLPGAQLCLSCARRFAARLLAFDVDWSVFGQDKAANREAAGDLAYEVEVAADLSEARCQAQWGSGWCIADRSEGGA